MIEEYVCSTCGYRTDDAEELDWYNGTDYYCPICGENVYMEQKARTMMKEILGFGVETAFNELNIVAKRTYSDNKKYEVWELSDKDHEAICNVRDKDWKKEWGWWRSSEGSNQGTVNSEVVVNGKKLRAWAPDLDGIYDGCMEFSSLTDYFHTVLRVGQPRNICALSVDLAKQNDITLGELFQRYQGQES